MIELLQERPPQARTPIAILGVPFDNITTAETIEEIERMVASRQPHYIITANVDFIVQARSDVELRRILFDADLVLCDGTPLVWASRLLGNPLLERVAGADLVPLLLRVASDKGHRVFFLGATPDSVAQAVENLKQLHPDLVIAGYYSPPFNKLLEMDHEEIERRILKAQPDLLFVSFGCPKQEKWIAMHYRSLGVPVSVGVGATIDFLAGTVKRAPVWMQRIGAEWIYRLAQEPRRLFKRYAKDLFVFGWKIFVQLWQLQLHSRRPERPQTGAPVRFQQNWQLIRAPQWFDLAAVRDGALRVEQIVADDHDCLLQMDKVKFIDSSGVGLLVQLQKKMRAANHQLVLLAPSSVLKRALALMRLQNFFASAPDLAAARLLIEERTREQFETVRLRKSWEMKTLVWQGEITAANARAVWAATEAHLEFGLREELVIDLSAVRFVDSTGLGLMVRAKKLARENRVRLKFTNPQPAVKNVIKLARLREFLLAEEEMAVPA